MEKYVRIISVSTLSLLGVFCISSGIMYKSLEDKKNNTNKILIVVEEKQLTKNEDVNLKLKNLTLNINTPLSINVKDYLETTVTDEVLANLKLDTSNVNVTKKGTYNYSISYKKKVYNGIIVIKENEIVENKLPSITLKTLNITLGNQLSPDISNYVIEPLNDEMKSKMLLDLSNVNINKAGNYQYTIKYDNSIYTGNITITATQPTLSTNINDQEQNTTNNTSSNESTTPKEKLPE